MIFYGSRATTLTKGQIRNVKCSHCDTDSTMTYHVFGKYAHVYWVPLFPMEKICVVECNNCSKTFEFAQFTEQISNKLKIEKERNPAKNPIWYYSGLFIIASLIGYGFYSSQKEDSDTQAYFENPKEGDVYETKSGSGGFTTLKFIGESKNKDSLYFYLNDMEIDQSSAIHKIDLDKYYNEVYSFDKAFLDSLYNSKYIYKINRNK